LFTLAILRSVCRPKTDPLPAIDRKPITITNISQRQNAVNTESQIAEAFVYYSAGLFGFISSTTILADSTGNNGQCRQLQKTFLPELQDLSVVMTRLPDGDIMSHRRYHLDNSNTLTLNIIHIIALAVNECLSLFSCTIEN
jgi:hypothetical protein